MDYNPKFYNAAIALCDEMITQMIEDAKKLAAEEELECGTLEDVETLEDLIMAAANEALRQMEDLSNSRMSEITGGIGGVGGLF